MLKEGNHVRERGKLIFESTNETSVASCSISCVTIDVARDRVTLHMACSTREKKSNSYYINYDYASWGVTMRTESSINTCA